MFFRLSSVELGLVIFGIVLGATVLGIFAGRSLRAHVDALREPLGVLQGALLGLVALILAFGLTMAVGRYDSRRAAVVHDSNAIGTTFLRAQLLDEPVRTQSLESLRRYADTSIELTDQVPDSAESRDAVEDGMREQRTLWRLAADAVRAAPTDTAPRLYVESLNEMIDTQTVRVAALRNRVPTAVLAIELIGAAIALFLLATYLSILSRGVLSVVIAAVFVSVLLLITFDLDRPTRGMVTVPDTPLVVERESMDEPPAAPAAPE